jgi:hypothetical protein
MLKGILTGGLMLAAVAAAAQPAARAEDLAGASTLTGQPASHGLPTSAARITGFRSARFGDSPADVQAAVARDFGAAAAAALAPEQVEPGFTALATRADVAEMGGKANLLYVFEGDALVAVNLVVATGDRPTDKERDALVQQASRIASSLLEQTWRPFATVRGRPLPGGQIILFAAADDLGDGVELRLVNIGHVPRLADGRTIQLPATAGASALRLVFRQDIDGLSILKAGDF